MAKLTALLCFCATVLAVAVTSVTAGDFNVVGKVYCDTCNTGFPTRASYDIKGAKVQVKCTKADGSESYLTEGETNEKGEFRLAVKGEHEHEQCKVKAVSSPAPCDRPTDMTEGTVFLTHNNGIQANERQTGPFGFSQPAVQSDCGTVLQEYSLYDDDDDINAV